MNMYVHLTCQNFWQAPMAFGNLSRAIIQLFRIAAGETWVEGMPVCFFYLFSNQCKKRLFLK